MFDISLYYIFEQPPAPCHFHNAALKMDANDTITEVKGKTCRLAFRLTEEEKQHLESRAAIAGTGLSNYVRQTLLENKTVLTTADDRRQIKGMAVNLNQIAYKVNASGLVPKELNELISQINKVLADAYRQR